MKNFNQTNEFQVEKVNLGLSGLGIVLFLIVLNFLGLICNIHY